MEFQAPQTVAEPPEPANPTRFGVWGPFATVLWSVLIAVVFVLTEFVAMIAYASLRPNGAAVSAFVRELRFDGGFHAYCTLASLLVGMSLVLGIVRLKRGSNSTDYLALRWPPLKQVLLWSLITFGFCLLFDWISLLLHRPMVGRFLLATYGAVSPSWMLWLVVVTAEPIFEEVCFRGFIFKGLAASRLRWQGAAIITAVLWTIFYLTFDWYWICLAFGLGLLLGTARAMTNSTLLTMLLHCLINVLATVQVAIAARQI
ncbi:MAG TPA: CPBP family intramembrane glutamic endopeptidase [Chthoniobacterales bacterium]|nr:CPBP family intramembrane glutamic endopeptidase [Chthoniobacterales bacterium]